MTITLSGRKIATLLALIGLLLGGLFVATGGHSSAVTASSSSPSNVRCVGTQSGAIGSTKGIPLVGASDGIIAPYDIASGQASGKRQHKPYTFTIASDAAGGVNVLLTNALVNNENLKSCTFHYLHRNVQGVEKVYLTVALTNARLTSYSFSSGGTVQWQLVYQKITWTDNEALKTASDDWAAPVA